MLVNSFEGIYCVCICASGVVLNSLQRTGGITLEWTQSVFWMSHFIPGTRLSGLQNPKWLTPVQKKTVYTMKTTHVTTNIRRIICTYFPSRNVSFLTCFSLHSVRLIALVKKKQQQERNVHNFIIHQHCPLQIFTPSLNGLKLFIGVYIQFKKKIVTTPECVTNNSSQVINIHNNIATQLLYSILFK